MKFGINFTSCRENGKEIAQGVAECYFSVIATTSGIYPKISLLPVLIYIIERLTDVSEVFSLVMKTHNCLRRTYVSSSRIATLPFSPGYHEPLPLLGMRTKIKRLLSRVQVIKSLDSDRGWTDATCRLSTSFQ